MKTSRTRFAVLAVAALLLLMPTVMQAQLSRNNEIRQLVRQNTDQSVLEAARIFFADDSIIAMMCDLGNPLYTFFHTRCHEYFSSPHDDSLFKARYPEAEQISAILKNHENPSPADKIEWEKIVRSYLSKIKVENAAVTLNIIQQGYCNLTMTLPGEDIYEQRLNELEFYDKNHGYIGTRTYKRINGCLGDYSGNGAKACNLKVITSINQIQGTFFGNVDRKVNGVPVGDEPLYMNQETYEAILMMDAITNNSSLPIPVNLIRVITFAGASPYLGITRKVEGVSGMYDYLEEDMKIGEIICSTQSFLSMSTDASSNFFIGWNDRRVIFNVRVPANTSMYVSCHFMESEVVFPRLAKGRVIKIGTTDVPSKSNPEEILDMLSVDIEMIP